MKINTLFPALILLTGFYTASGQTGQQKKVKRISLSDFYVQAGLFSERNTNGTLSDFRALAPQSVLLNNNLTGYFSNRGWSSAINNTMYTVMLGLQFSNKEKTMYKPNPQLRLGVSFFSETMFTNHLYKEDRKPYDTLTSAQTQEIIYIDSITTKSYNMYYSYDQLRIDGSLIFRTNPKARWVLYSGIGVTAGISINAQTNIYYDIYRRTYGHAENNGSSIVFFFHSGSGSNETEKIKNENNSGFSTYIPIGINFRIGNEREFWKQANLFFEVRPGINHTSIPELQPITNARMQCGLGLRVSW